MRKRGKTDANQTEIVQALRQTGGCEVLSMAALGAGAPDLLIWRRGTLRFYLCEIKDGSKPASRRKLTPDQINFHRLWPVHVVTSIDEALAVVGVKRRK